MEKQPSFLCPVRGIYFNDEDIKKGRVAQCYLSGASETCNINAKQCTVLRLRQAYFSERGAESKLLPSL